MKVFVNNEFGVPEKVLSLFNKYPFKSLMKITVVHWKVNKIKNDKGI